MRSQTARLYDSGSSAKILSRFATLKDGSVSWRPIARIGERTCFQARNEECGLRCIYHGWKYDVDGNCVDIPSEPEETRLLKQASGTKHVAAIGTAGARGGVVLDLYGTSRTNFAAEPPNFEGSTFPPRPRTATKRLQSFLQGWAPGSRQALYIDSAQMRHSLHSRT